MLAGFLYQHTCVQLWPAFLNGELYGTGRWNYFPLAILYKTPVAELVGFFLAGCAFALMGFGIRMGRRPAFQSLWLLCCLIVPWVIFSAAAISTHLNIGLRNILPLYPFLYIACGCAAAFAWNHRPKITLVILMLLSVGLMTETLYAWPNYIGFFNYPTGGGIGGLAHLSDSNLDWGQDIQSLAQWQKTHADRPMYARLYERLIRDFTDCSFIR